MAKVSMSMDLGANAEQVWQMIGGFNALPNWHPAVEKSEVKGDGEGSVRTLHLVGGGTITERLDQKDESGRSYTYTILTGPLPVANYTSTIRLVEGEDGKCAVEWESDFEPSGAPEQDAVQAIQGVYAAGLENLKKMFGL